MNFLNMFNNKNTTDGTEKFPAFLDYSANGIFFMDAQFAITHANKTAKQLFEQHQQAFQAALPLFDFNNPVNKNLTSFSLIPVEAVAAARNHKTWSQTLDVATEKFHFTLTPFFDAQNSFEGAMLEFWWAMEAADSDKFQAFLNHSANGILFMDAQFAITHASTRAKQLFLQYQQAFQTVMPLFDVNNLISKNLKNFSLISSEAIESVRNHKTWARMLDVATEKFHFTLTPFFDAQNGFKGAMLEFWWATDYQKMEVEAARASSIVREMTISVMTCDSNRVITSMNPAVAALLNKYKLDLQKLLPTFDPDKLIGVNIDSFHKNPDAQKRIFADPSKLPYKTRIKLFDMAFDLVVFPLKDLKGKINGYAVEWVDATQAANGVTEVNRLAQKIIAGELSTRLNVEDFAGDMKAMANSLNIMLDAIVEPLNGVAGVLAQIEQGDLTRIIEGDYKGDLKDFKDTVNNTVVKLSSTIQEVINATEQLGNASEQISATSQSLSQASSEQASSVEQTSSSVEQMAASINQNAENAKITNGMASKAAQEASEGGVAVKQTVGAMQEIANKIGIIDDIAYQTNMLALNAAIEAARAGDHGKGFAVVAAEVRKLAERSQVAAQEIGRLAESSVKTAETAGKLLGEIVPSIMKTSDLVQEISAASQEQSAGVSQINTAMNQMNQVTQQNASASEELAATAEEMTSQTEQLQDLMRFFKIGNAASVGKQSTAKHARRMHDKAKPALVVNHNPFEAEAEFDLSKFNRF